MEQFTIGEEGYKKIRKKTLMRTLLISLCSIVFGLTVGLRDSDNIVSDLLMVLPYLLPMWVIAIFVGRWMSAGRNKRIIESYTLTFESNMIVREQLNLPAVSIYYIEIKEIVKYRNGTIIIKGRERRDVICVPAQIDRYSDVEFLLDKIKPIKVKGSV